MERLIKEPRLKESTELFCERYKIREERRRREANPPTSIFFPSNEAVDMTLKLVPNLGMLTAVGMFKLNVANQSVLDYLNTKLTTNE